MQKPSVPKGTRDFTPGEMIRRQYILGEIEKVFKSFGYLPIETPAIETLETLLGKYGEEGDKLLFRILNSGDFLSELDQRDLASKDSARVAMQICEKGLRYDLTVPFARFVVQNRNEINFPFKRYQIQPVWRADKPQKGRYREFYQCDADVIGSNALLNEAELLLIIDRVFKALNLRVRIRLNHRKILTGLAEAAGIADQMNEFTVALDKLDKVGLEGVLKELRERGVPAPAISMLKPIITAPGSNADKLSVLAEALTASETGKKGLEEMQSLLEYVETSDLQAGVVLDISLARGLDYYTGNIIEVLSREMEIGSICGGGRYDDLTGIFGLPDISGVGISFGADRIYDVLKKLDRFPETTKNTTELLFVNFMETRGSDLLKMAGQCRDAGIVTELYPDPSRLKKQLNYANKNNIPYVAMAGEKELGAGKITLKDMQSGNQESMTLEEIIRQLAGPRDKS